MIKIIINNFYQMIIVSKYIKNLKVQYFWEISLKYWKKNQF